jgi:GGDEF domain-containing protein
VDNLLSGMKGFGGLAGALGAGLVALALSLAVFVLPRNVAAGIAFVAFLAVWALVLWLWLGGRTERRRARVDSLMKVGQRSPALTLYDPVTGLCAGWYFKLRLQEEVTRATRYKLPLGLMLIESPENRREAKSKARVISAMASTFRTSDLVGHIDESRYGVLLLNTNAEASRTAEERLRASIGEQDAIVGLACYPEDANDWRDLLTKAGASPAELYGEGVSDGAAKTADNVLSIEDLRRFAGERGRWVA